MEATREQNDEFWRRMNEVIVAALLEMRRAHGDAIALAFAWQLDRRELRLMAECDVDSNGVPDVETLQYRVDVKAVNTDEWFPLVLVGWRDLGVTEELAADEAQWTAYQNGYGIPDDLRRLDPPST